MAYLHAPGPRGGSVSLVRRARRRPFIAVSCLAGLAAASSSSFAAEIVHLDQTFAVVNVGTADGLSLGDELCFSDKEGVALECAPIQSIRSRMAGVELSDEVLVQLQEGLPVRSKKPLTKRENQKKNRKKSAPATAAAPGPQSRLRIDVGYLFSAVTPYRYQAASYRLVNEVAGSGPLWEGNQKVQSSKNGFALSVTWPLTSSLALVPGLHVRRTRGDVVLVDYDRNDGQAYARCETSSSSLGASFDVMASMPWGSWQLSALGGIDADQSKVKFAATPNGDRTTSLAKLESSMLALSLRAGGKAEYMWGRFGISLGVTGLLPVAGKASHDGGEAQLKSSVSATQVAQSGEDLAAAVGHERSSFAAQMSLGVSAGF